MWQFIQLRFSCGVCKPEDFRCLCFLLVKPNAWELDGPGDDLFSTWGLLFWWPAPYRTPESEVHCSGQLEKLVKLASCHQGFSRSEGTCGCLVTCRLKEETGGDSSRSAEPSSNFPDSPPLEECESCALHGKIKPILLPHPGGARCFVLEQQEPESTGVQAHTNFLKGLR